MGNRISKYYGEADCDAPQLLEDAEFGCGEELDDIAIPPEMINIIESQKQATYESMSYAAVEKLIFTSAWEKQAASNKPREIPPDIGSVTEMTRRLFPGCELKADMIDGDQFNEPSHILVRVLWSDAQMTVEQKNAALISWHSELFAVAPTIFAGAFRLQLEYPE